MQVINAYVDFTNVETEEASFITTFEAWKLATNNLGDQRLTFKKLIADKCVRRHLVRNTDYVWTLLLDICIEDNICIYLLNLVFSKVLSSRTVYYISGNLYCNDCFQVFVPMHINNNHWALLVLNFIKKEVQILNSLASTPEMRDENKEKALVSTA